MKPKTLHRGRIAGLFAASAVLLALSACGSDNNNDSPIDYGDNFKSAFAVFGQADFSGQKANRGGAAGVSTLSSPSGSIASNGSYYYVPDSANNRVLGFASAPGTGGAASFVLGQADFSGTAPATTQTSFAQPTKVSASADGKLVVADANNNRVLIWNTLPTTTGKAPDVVVGQTDFVSNGAGTTASTLSYPTGAMIGNGKLVVVDQNNNRVLVWNTVPTSSGTAADVVLGQPGFTSRISGYYDNTGNAGLTRLNLPADVWTDGFKLLVSDTGNNRVLYWNQVPSTSDTPTSFIIGQTSVTRITAGTTSTIFNAPIGVGSDGQQLYIADTGNNRVMVYPSFPVSTGTAAATVIGQGDFNHGAYNDDRNESANKDGQDGVPDTNPTARTLHTPIGTFARNGTLFVTDRDNHRLLSFTQ